MPRFLCLTKIVFLGFSAWLINLGCTVMLKRQGISFLCLLIPTSSLVHFNNNNNNTLVCHTGRSLVWKSQPGKLGFSSSLN